MYVQLSIDNVIGTGWLAGDVMSRQRYVAFKDMARELVEEFASANGWVDTTVEEHVSYDEWSGATSTKIAAYATEVYATEVSADVSDFDLHGRVATLAWQFSQESIHVVSQGYDDDADAGLVYGRDAVEAVRRETYVEKQGGFDPWDAPLDQDEGQSHPGGATLQGVLEIVRDLANQVAQIREDLGDTASPVTIQSSGLVYDEDEEVYDALAALVDGGDDWWEASDEAKPAPFEIKVNPDDVAKAREVVRRVLSHPDADEMTLDIFGKALSLPAELSDGFTIVRSTTD